MLIRFSAHSRRRAALLLVAVGIGTGLPLVTASSSSAAVVCGSSATARVSIVYRACVESVTSTAFTAHYQYGNNHGAAVAISTRYGWKVGSKTEWFGPSTITLRKAAGFVERESNTWVCEKGQRGTAVVQVKQNNGDWGPTASFLTLTCG